MNGVVRFKREKNRTAEDVFNNMIMEKVPLAMDVVQQKITHHNKNNHSYHNRTGALEESVSWMPAKRQGDKVVGAVLAGGPSKSTQAYVKTHVFYVDEAGTLRVFPLKEPEVIPKGTPIDVDYAAFVEVAGMPVLKQGIEHYRHQVAAMVGRILRSKKLPRMYTFKGSGVTADIYGQS